MRIQIGIILLLITFSFCYGKDKQKIKRVRNYFDTEYFEIDKLTKEYNGQYVKLDRDTKDTIVWGKYKNGTRTGVWSFYGPSNQPYFKFDYDNLEITYKSPYLNLINEFIIEDVNGEYILSKVERPAICLDGMFELKKQAGLKFTPDFFDLMGINNNFILASLIINEDGDMDSVVIEKAINPELDAAVIKSLNKLNLKWLPAIKNDKNVKSKVFINYYIYRDADQLNFMQKRIMDNPYTTNVFLLYQFKIEKY
ncbi:energy transducer TonB [Saccharicrinis sp. FJH62]|uniref:energy transducer TonB n=1 Tax=Saccharicrinis sp. FJH62 TaxID=3344657 RepID=UPI0035D431A5